MSDDLLMKKRVISITFAELILQRLINRVQRNEDRGLSLERWNTIPRRGIIQVSSFAEVLKMVCFNISNKILTRFFEWVMPVKTTVEWLKRAPCGCNNSTDTNSLLEDYPV